MLTILGLRVRLFVHLERGRDERAMSAALAVMLTVGGAACGVHAGR